jgi:hypothetical protein
VCEQNKRSHRRSQSVYVEFAMAHGQRILRVGGRAHLPTRLYLWMGYGSSPPGLHFEFSQFVVFLEEKPRIALLLWCTSEGALL